MDLLDKAIILKLQEDLPLVLQPYKHIADELGICEEELLSRLKELNNKKVLRRIGAILYHRTAGFKANAMVVWNIPECRIKEVTDIMISFSEVSHCYRREVLSNWNYNIYTMVHSKTFEQCDNIISQISACVNIDKYEVLYSTRELKKSSMKYFY
ncbi:Lrp/AsnC family transcriptional regulator [Clostridium sp. WILCCON 0269]|uniref:siroheme decarboxylase n=1 Tax=Candidatus Clostridium eludens TaxID=3381663 RepID=A0ABW8SMP9_9CLOT